MTRYCTVLLIALLMSLTASAQALAQNTGGVFGPIVNEDHKAIQYRITVDPEDAAGELGFAQRLHYEQSINDAFMWRIVGQTRKTVDSDFDFDYLQGELFWQLTHDTARNQMGFRLDGRVRSDNRPNQVGLNWMTQFDLGDDWHARALALSTAQFGDNAADGVFLESRFNIYKRFDTGFTAGLEMFNKLGNTDDEVGIFKTEGHSIGPFVSAPLTRDVSIFAGALFGISDVAADEELRLWITKTF